MFNSNEEILEYYESFLIEEYDVNIEILTCLNTSLHKLSSHFDIKLKDFTYDEYADHFIINLQRILEKKGYSSFSEDSLQEIYENIIKNKVISHVFEVPERNYQQ